MKKIMSIVEDIYKKRWRVILKVSLNLTILLAIIYIILEKGGKFYPLFNLYLLFTIPYEFFILFLISFRIFYIARTLNENITLKKIYFVTITTKFYNILLPSIFVEAIRAAKYYFAGLQDKYNILFLVAFDRIMGFITFFIIFLFSIFSMKIYNTNYSVLMPFLIIYPVHIIASFNMGKIRHILHHTFFDRHLSKKTLFLAFLLSFSAQMAIILKYFYLFRLLGGLDLDFIKTLYIGSASHLSQIIPVSSGIFSIKDGLLLFILSSKQNEYITALRIILFLGGIEIITGIIGGIVESIGLTKKTVIHQN